MKQNCVFLLTCSATIWNQQGRRNLLPLSFYVQHFIAVFFTNVYRQMAFVIVLKILTHLFSSLKFFINTVFDVKFPIPVKSLLSNIKIGQIY